MPRKKKPYHRENLRQELLDAGRAYVEKHGHNGLSIRTLAQVVGVSPGAPYHHFPERRSLLLAIAVEGFTELLADMNAVLHLRRATAEKLLELGRSFVRFSSNNPHLVDLMYESELTAPKIDPALKKMQIAAHDALNEVLAGAAGINSKKEIEFRGLAFWSAVYGYASMKKKGLVEPYGPSSWKSDDLTAAILRQAVLAALAV